MASNLVHGKTIDELLGGMSQRNSMMAGAGVSVDTANFFKQAASLDNGMMIRAAQSPSDNLVSKQITDIVMLLDASWSMLGRIAEVVHGINHGFRADIQEDRNPERNNQRVTMYLYNTTIGVDFLSVDIDANGDNARITGLPVVSTLEINSIPVMKLPEIHEDDYECTGGTPMNKTILLALGAQSLQSEALQLGLVGKRTASTKMIVGVGDGGNTEWSERGIDLSNQSIKVVADDLTRQETWSLLWAMTTDAYVELDDLVAEIGFHKGRLIEPGGWRDFMNIVSQSAQQVSMSANNGGSASNLAQSNNFF